MLPTDDSQTINSGGTAKFTIKISNDSTKNIKNLEVTDAKAPACNRTIEQIKELIKTKYS